jgi:hypothetical protein
MSLKEKMREFLFDSFARAKQAVSFQQFGKRKKLTFNDGFIKIYSSSF